MNAPNFAILFPDSQIPVASFFDLPTALAWGLQQFRAGSFLIGVIRHDRNERQEDPEQVQFADFLTRSEASAEVMAYYDKHEESSWSRPSAALVPAYAVSAAVTASC